MVWRSLHHKEILLSEPGRNRRECILTRNSPKFWYGNLNRHVCHKWKYEDDRPSRSTEVNPGKSRSVAFGRVFDLKFNEIHLTKVIRKRVVYGQNIIDLSICEIEPRFQLFSASWEQWLFKFCFIWVEKYVGQKRDTMCSHWDADYLLENLSRKHHENVVYQKLKHLDDAIFRVLVFGVRVFLHKIMFLCDPKLDICICGCRFWKWRNFEWY